MITHLEKKIALRYLSTRKKDGFLNIITIFSFTGISLGVAVLIIVMSVMNGFRNELVDKVTGFNAHVVIKPYEKTISLDANQENKLKSISESFVFSNDGEGIVIVKDNTKGLLLRGYNTNDFSKLKITKNDGFRGITILESNYISIGNELSFDLNLKIGDKISILSPKGENTLIGKIPNQKVFEIKSIFKSGFAEFDRSVAFININDLEKLFDLNKENKFLEIYLKSPEKVDKISKVLREQFSTNFIYTWADINRPLFSALKVERNVMFIILSLIIIVAAFNIISGLTILVKNKTRDIAILKSIGVKNKSIKKIFFIIGLLIGFTATTTGVIVGILFSVYIENIRKFISDFFGVGLFPEEIYFLSTIPYSIDFKSILLIMLCSIFSTCLVSLYPAIKASQIDTVKALKYE